jgi:AcrR family transcriptional regulator
VKEIQPRAGRVGRRPGGLDTRGQIVAAARSAFGDQGYDGTSLRAIARRAEVDASLVHHYFPRGKPELFAAAMYMGALPHSIGPGDGTGPKGHLIVRSFLSMWEPDSQSDEPPGGSLPFAAFAQAISASPAAGVAMREFLADRIWSRIDDQGEPEVWQLRHALVATELMGMGMARYVLFLEPFASATLADLEAWVGPMIDTVLTRPL